MQETYKEYRRDGSNKEELIRRIIDDYHDQLNDSDDSEVIWLTLALLLWKDGWLMQDIKEKALAIIDSGSNLSRWQSENASMARKREIALRDLEEKLRSPQREEKAPMKPPRKFVCEWKNGDVFAYKPKGDESGQHDLKSIIVLIYKFDDFVWDKYTTIPRVYLKVTNEFNIPNSVQEFNQLPYLRLRSVSCTSQAICKRP